MFTLLFWEVKERSKDDPRELGRIKHMQIKKNFDNWLSTYTIYMGVFLQVHLV